MKQQHKRRQIKFNVIMLTIALTIISTVVMAQEINWFSIDGGGGVSSNGNTQLIGVIGQSDTGRMSAGGVSISSGYLPLPAVSTSTQDPIFKNGFE